MWLCQRGYRGDGLLLPGENGHAETVYVVYDPEKLPLETLLTYYYGIIDPTLVDQQAYDVGPQYRTGIYFVDEDDLEVIKKVTEEEQKKYRQPIVTQIEPLKNYVLAEEYHQDYLVKNPWGYCHVDLTSIPQEKPRVEAGDYQKPSLEELRAAFDSRAVRDHPGLRDRVSFCQRVLGQRGTGHLRGHCDWKPFPLY